jgi:hypothetical protein
VRVSVAYQAIVEEGIEQDKVKALQDSILRLGRKQIHTLEPAIETSVRSISDPERLARLLDGVMDASGWEELLVIL